MSRLCQNRVGRFHISTSFSQRTINVWNKLSAECVHDASSVNMFKNRIDKYLVKAGYT